MKNTVINWFVATLVGCGTDHKDKMQWKKKQRTMPVSYGQGKQPTTNRDWWPNQLDLTVLRQHCLTQWAKTLITRGINSLDYAAVKEDPRKVMTDSKDWWLADFRTLLGPLFIRMAWHSAGNLQNRRW